MNPYPADDPRYVPTIQESLERLATANLAEVKGLNYGPRPDRGDGRTPLAAGDYPSTHGPSWRMVVDWGSGTFQGIYPGGQSENPASDWYTDRVDTWFAGRLNPMLTAEQAAAAGGIRTWDMRP